MFTNIQLRYQAQLVVASILLLLPGEKIGILMRLENTSHISIVSSAKRPFDKCWWNFLIMYLNWQKWKGEAVCVLFQLKAISLKLSEERR